MHFLRLSILESRISEISYSGSPSITIGRSGVGSRFGKVFGDEGSNIETWKTGWIDRRCSGSQRVNESDPT